MTKPVRMWPWSLAVSVATFVALASCITDLGETWDEPVYSAAAEKAAGWFGQLAAGRDAFSKQALHEGWVYGRFGIVFHPPGAGYPAMLLEALLGGTVSPLAAYRLANALQFSLAVGLVCGFVGSRAGRFAGVMAAAALVTMPRAIGDALLFSTDIPAMLWWVVIAICYLRALDEPRPLRQAAFGLALGYGFLVKPTAVLVILPLAVWSIGRMALRSRTQPTADTARGAARSAALLAAVATPLLIAAGVMWALHGGMRAHTERQIALGIGAQRQWTYAQQEARLAQELPKWLMHVDLLNPGVADPTGGAMLLLLPAGLWLLRSWRLRQNRTLTAKPHARKTAPDGAQREEWLGPCGPEVELALAALALAPAVVYLLGPCWWRDPLLRLAHYLALNFQRQGALPDIEILYFGQKYLYTLPWHNAYALLAVVTPVGTLALLATGIWAAIARWRKDPADSWALFLLVQFMTLPVLRMLGVPAHDGVRLMQPTLWFLAALAGVGAAWIVSAVAGRQQTDEAVVSRRGSFAAMALAVVMLAALVNLVRCHPHELSYHNQLIGGLPGAWRAGCEVTYWYDAVNRAALEKVRDALPEGAVLQHHQHVDVFADWERDVLGEKKISTTQAPPRSPSEHTQWLQKTWLGLLTHGSKSNPTMRLAFSMRPHLVAAEYDGVPLYSVYSPQTVARATALTLLLQVDGEQPGKPGPAMDRARWNDRMLDLAGNRPAALRAAAKWLAERLRQDAEQTTAKQTPAPPKLDDAPAEAQIVLKVLVGDEFENWGYWRHWLGQAAVAFPQAIPQAAEILIADPVLAAERATSAGYLPIERYLDESVE